MNQQESFRNMKDSPLLAAQQNVKDLIEMYHTRSNSNGAEVKPNENEISFRDY